MSTDDIVQQLNAFGYNEKEIKKAIDTVQNKQDINAVQEYLDSNVNKSVKVSASTATYFDKNKELNLSRYNQLCAVGNKKEINLVNEYVRGIQSQFPNDFIFYVIPTVINQYICLFYIDYMRCLTWNNVFYTKSKLSFEDNLKLCRHESNSGYAYVSADIEPISSGVHCFRVLAHSDSRNTLFFSFMRYGLDKDNLYKYDSFYSAQLYGTTTHGYTVSNGSNKNDGLANPSAEYQLDLLIDCEQKHIKIGFVKEWTGQIHKRLEIIHKNIPEWQWIPHFNLYDGRSWIKIIQIDPSLYRIQNDEADALLSVVKKKN